MRKYLSQILRFLLSPSQPPEKQWLVMVVIFLLAVILWFAVTLNRPYSSQISYTVAFQDIPESIAVTEIMTPKIQVMVQGTGLSLLGKHLRFRRDTIFLSLTKGDINYEERFLYTADHIQDISDYLIATVSSISPAKVHFEYKEKARKKVPVILQTKIQLKPAYQLVSPAVPDPDSVTLIGMEEVLDTINVWYTEAGSTPLISKREIVYLDVVDTIPSLEIQPNKVAIEVNPRLYTQASLRYKLEVSDIPDSVHKVRLSQNEIHYNCLIPVPDYEKVLGDTAQYKIDIPFSELQSNSNQIMPEPTLPKGVQLLWREPNTIGYIIVSR